MITSNAFLVKFVFVFLEIQNDAQLTGSISVNNVLAAGFRRFLTG